MRTLIALLALMVAPLTIEQRPRDPNPITVTGPVGFAPGDSLVYGLSWVPANPCHCTGYTLTVTAGATNGVWSGLPTNLAVAGSSDSFTASATPWDSVTFTAVVFATNGAVLSKNASSVSWKVRHLPVAPGPITVDSSKTVIGMLVEPPTATVAIGGTVQLCAYPQFYGGAVATRSQDAALCDPLRLSTWAAASPTQQAHADSLCFLWTSSAGAATVTSEVCPQT